MTDAVKPLEERLAEWFVLDKQLREIKAKEMELRKSIFGMAFPDPKEGTNTFQLPDNFALKGVFKWNRDVDIAAFQAMKEQFMAKGIAADGLVKFKPELVGSKYKELTEEQRTMFDQCLIIKPGSPSLEVVQPKSRTTAALTSEGVKQVAPNAYDADAACQ